MGAYLPEERTSIVGREACAVRLQQALSDGRMVTVTGPGGVGKSRLALRVATAATQRAADRQTQSREKQSREAQGRETQSPEARGGSREDLTDFWWVDLSPLMNDRLLVPSVADAVGLADHTPRMPTDALCQWLKDKRGLLVLDSCEHLVASCRDLVSAVLSGAPGVTVLATSRRRLRVPGERVVRLAPLAMPRGTGAPGHGEGDALGLFTARTLEHSPDAYFDAPHWPRTAARICARLDGIPLALELAAGQLRRHSVEEVAAQLDRQRRHLRRDTPGPVAPARHEALWTTIGWSHELCSPRERLLWARFAVFRGPVHTRTVQAVCGGQPLSNVDLSDKDVPDKDVPDQSISSALAGLAEQSVITRRSSDLWSMLDTMREYGHAWLRMLGEDRNVTDRHAHHYLGLARRADAEWLSGDQVTWYRRVSASHPDLCGALEHLLATDPARALELAGHVAFFWSCCGHLHEARDYLERALARFEGRGPVRTRALWALGVVRLLQGEQDVAKRLARQCERAAAQDGDTEGQLAAAYLSGIVHLMAGLPLVALHKADRGLALRTGSALSAAGMRCRLVRVFALTALGALDDAKDLAEQMSSECRELGESLTLSYVEYQLALIALFQDRPADAARHARAMLLGKRALGDRFGIALGLDLLAAACAAQGLGEHAAHISGTGQAFWRTVGHPQRGTPELAPVREETERRARATAGDTVFARARQRGARDAEAGLDLACGEPPAPSG